MGGFATPSGIPNPSPLLPLALEAAPPETRQKIARAIAFMEREQTFVKGPFSGP
jgi:hypothetical protein